MEAYLEMELLKDYILNNGKTIGSKILKVDSFLNHQIDPVLMMKMGEEFKKRFEGVEINKILTIEASGIAIGLAAAYALNVPLVFAKKKVPSTMSDFYTTKVFSFTKNQEYTICVGKDFLQPEDKVLIIDDFLKNTVRGNTVNEKDFGIIYEIIDYRYKYKKPVIITSEYFIDHMFKLNESIAGRLKEMVTQNGYNFLVQISNKEGRNYRMRGMEKI